MNIWVGLVVKYLPKREEGRKLLSIVRDSYRWYSQSSVEHSGISNTLSSDLFTDEHRIVRIEKNDSLNLLGAYILGFGVRERFISKELLENLEFNLRYLSPLMLAKVLEIKPNSLLDYKVSNEIRGLEPKLVRTVPLPDGTLDYLVDIKDMAKLTIPPVDMRNLDSLSNEEAVCRYKLSGNEIYGEIVYKKFRGAIYSIINKDFSHQQDFLGEQDLFSMGVLGLFNAMNSYDLTKGTKFNTYASIKIKGSISDGLRKITVSTRGLREAIRTLNPYIEEGERSNKELDVDLLAEITGLNQDMVKRALEVRKRLGFEIVSLDQPRGGSDDNSPLYETIPSHEFDAPDVEPREEKIRDVVNRALALLPTEERDIIFAHYFQGVTLMKLGERYGISESRVSQLITGIQERLRKTIDPSQIGF